MAQAYVCPDCGTRYSRKPQAERGERCPVCNRRKQQPLVYWRVIGVALGTTTLLLITLIFALKAWADSRRSAAPPPGIGDKNSFPTILTEQPEATGMPEVKPEPSKKEQPPPPKEEEPRIAPKDATPPAAPVSPPAKPQIAKAQVAIKPDPEKPAEPVIAEPSIQEAFKRIDLRSEEALRKELVQVPIFRRSNALDASLLKLASLPKERNLAPHEIPDFAGLPMRMGIDCQLGKEPAEHLQVLSRKLRAALAAAIPKDGSDPRPDAVVLAQSLLGDTAGNAGAAENLAFPFKMLAPFNFQPPRAASEWVRPEAVPTLVQMLMAENKPIRFLLVVMLARNPSREASVALAQRALFDLSAEVREAAVRALKTRPFEELRDTLWEGLRHPWAPVNDHAAEALVALHATEVVADLVGLLDQPRAAALAPANSGEKLHVREMARVNHLANCTLCHPRSLATTDLVRGQVPDPNGPVTPGAYQQERATLFVHADETYLRQDFSVVQPVSNPGNWPAFQRFDYVVRTQPVTVAQEIFGKPMEPLTVRQRRAVLFALRELTGTDAGRTATSWRRRLAEVEKRAPSGFN